MDSSIEDLVLCLQELPRHFKLMDALAGSPNVPCRFSDLQMVEITTDTLVGSYGDIVFYFLKLLKGKFSISPAYTRYHVAFTDKNDALYFKLTFGGET